jgi:glycosyltransferase involved in cell wall biosynthesis
MHFKIITPVYNADKWIQMCIGSVQAQEYRDYEHIIIDDKSTDRTLDILKLAANNYNVSVMTKDEHLGAMHSHILGAELACESGCEDDVFIHLDGDDWLAHSNVLSVIKDTYDKEDCLLTYGNYEATDKRFPSICKDKNPAISYRDSVRYGWSFSHIRTFKRALWEQLSNEDFTDTNGNLFSSACDVAMMCPLLELADDRVHFIQEVLYIYNRDNPLNDDKVSVADQTRCAFEVCAKQKKNRYDI